MSETGLYSITEFICLYYSTGDPDYNFVKGEKTSNSSLIVLFDIFIVSLINIRKGPFLYIPQVKGAREPKS